MPCFHYCFVSFHVSIIPQAPFFGTYIKLIRALLKSMTLHAGSNGTPCCSRSFWVLGIRREKLLVNLLLFTFSAKHPLGATKRAAR
jgi:hypothetical protein